jgi:ribosome-binding factor A
MAIELAELILEVRRELSDIPEDKITDLQVYDSLKAAKVYVDIYVEASTTEATFRECYKRVASVYAYINWTAIAERNMETQPATSYMRVAFLRENALAILRTCSKWQLDKNLIIDEKFYDDIPGCAGGLSTSVLPDEST